MATDWAEWHRAYDNPDSSLPRRLGVVQGYLTEWLDQADAQARALSLCAGEARDLIPALVARPDVEVSAVLVELDVRLAQTADAAVRAAGLDRVQVRQDDAGDPRQYADVGPVDLLLLAGIFGNISDSDIRATIDVARMLCAPGGWVIWTRHRHEPDLTGTLRTWFRDAGFEEVGFTGIESFGVGAQRYVGDTQAWEPPERLFTFFR